MRWAAKRCTSFHVVVMLLDITSGSRTVANATGMLAPDLIFSSACSERQTVSRSNDKTLAMYESD